MTFANFMAREWFWSGLTRLLAGVAQNVQTLLNYGSCSWVSHSSSCYLQPLGRLVWRDDIYVIADLKAHQIFCNDNRAIIEFFCSGFDIFKLYGRESGARGCHYVNKRCDLGSCDREYLSSLLWVVWCWRMLAISGNFISDSSAAPTE